VADGHHRSRGREVDGADSSRTAFPADTPACHQDSGPLPGLDSHRQAMASSRTRRTPGTTSRWHHPFCSAHERAGLRTRGSTAGWAASARRVENALVRDLAAGRLSRLVCGSPVLAGRRAAHQRYCEEYGEDDPTQASGKPRDSRTGHCPAPLSAFASVAALAASQYLNAPFPVSYAHSVPASSPCSSNRRTLPQRLWDQNPLAKLSAC
jgi:hypothetical protein